ncbi:menaquinone-dependent protoporphyrinogen oxidase [Pelolinea submarina]|nr:flavodoxin domain-containing protein [Pelolinea submarina]BBB48590.1 menaquinone-dependent protoporphyrinogen oxidase [Pelolinea submarina]
MMINKILVIYATWAGATHEIADEIGKQISKKLTSADIDVLPIKDVNSIEDYQAVIIGTSIHASQPIRSVNRFIKKHRNELAALPTAVFVVCANMWEDTPKSRNETTQWINKTLDKYPEIKPVSLGLFAGAVITEGEEFSKLSIIFRKTIESMQHNLIKQYGKTDFRDWDAIRSWADEVAGQFTKTV